MQQEALTDTIRKIILQETKIDVGNVETDTQLERLGIDSLDMLKLALAFERKFNVTITTSELMQIQTLADIVDGLSRKLAVENKF